MANYKNELEGQLQFYLSYLPNIDNNLTEDDILTDYTDGIINGNIIEFKLIINDLTLTLGQTIKYLSSMRLKGKSIPKNIILISLNEEKGYVYNSEEYLHDIEQVYLGSASRGIEGFSAKPYISELNFGDSERDRYKLVQLLRSNYHTKINLDENCIVGWAERFYRENPTADKSAFIGDQSGTVKIIGEIRKPTHFKNLIYPYTEKTNIKFQYLMDKLNDNLNKKNLGAFYTPIQYAEKSYELLYEAISRVPRGNDYIILDRCAGTGNLEKQLPDEILSHCVLSTIEYYEYKVLLELLADKVRYIIPPVESDDTFQGGLVRGANALSKEYIDNEVLQDFINDPNMTIIIFENPPYAETTSIEHQKKGKGKSSSGWKKSFVVEEMKKQVKGPASNDMGNAFIWSAFKYYLRQPTDSLIVYSPIKYWKAHHLIDKHFIKGFAFNRKHFHTNINACISCILWSGDNGNSNSNNLPLIPYDIDLNGNLKQEEKNISIKQVFSTYSNKYFDKRKFENDTTDGIWCELNGMEANPDKNKRSLNLYNDNIIGYLAVYSSGFDNPDLHSSLLRAARYDGNGFFLRNDNFMEKLPMFAASRYITYNRYWTERAQVMKSGDGSEFFYEDLKNNLLEDYLLKVLLFTCLEPQNHIRSLNGTDGRYYRNELCLDSTHGDTLATKKLKNMNCTVSERNLINQFELILSYAKKTSNYNPEFTYGLYQIDSELNTSYKDSFDNTVFDYPELNGEIKSLKSNIKKYYLKEIVPTLFKYELLK